MLKWSTQYSVSKVKVQDILVNVLFFPEVVRLFELLQADGDLD